MQKKNQLISTIIASAALFLALAPQGKSIAQEEMLSLFLLRRPCVNTGIGNWDGRNQDVAVGRAVYTSKIFMGPGSGFAAMTCKLAPNSAGVIFQRLNLAFGMRDNDRDSPTVYVNVYLDGQKIETKTVSPGEAATVSLDVTPTKNVSIEAVCSSPAKYCDRVYFWEADLTYPRLTK